MKRIALALAALAWSALAPACRAQIGINTALVTSSNSEAAWRNVARTMGPWVTSAPLTPQGYPTGPATTSATLVGYPGGVYEAEWQGAATLTFSGRGIASTPTGPNSALIAVADDHGHLLVAADGLDPADPMCWLKVVAPGDSRGPFRQAFLDIIEPFDHVRTMEWQRTNGNPCVSWADRTRPENFLKTGPAGVTYEDLCALAACSGKPLWVCVPFYASDDFVTRMAALFLRDYPPGLPITVEFSNEVWNTADPQGKQNYLNHGSNYGAGARYYADRSAQVAALWSAVWGDEAGRVRFVLTGQTGSTYWLATSLAECDVIGWHPDAIAIAPYVYLPSALDVDGLTPDGLFAGMESNLVTKVIPGIRAHAQLAAKYGLPLWSYEGGQALIAKAGHNAAVKAAAQDDPRMALLHAELFGAWAGAGGGVYTHYCLATAGTGAWWGLLTDGGQTSSVKYDGMLGLIRGLGAAAP